MHKHNPVIHGTVISTAVKYEPKPSDSRIYLCCGIKREGGKKKPLVYEVHTWKTGCWYVICDLCVTLSSIWQMWMSAALSWLAARPTLTVSTPMARTNAEVRTHTE